MSFAQTFSNWLDQSIPNEVPDGVVAFAFNLTQIIEDEYEIEVIGAESFDSEYEDWACEEIWEPVQRSLEIPPNTLGNKWEDVLANVVVLVTDYLSKGARKDTFLSVKGVGVGFVDGELQLVAPI